MTAVQADQMLVELRAIRQLLERATLGTVPEPVEQHVAMLLHDAPALGRADAPLTLVEFTDYQCTYCRRFHSAAFEEIKKNLVDTGKLRYVSVDLPLPMHARAPQAAAAAHCAGEQQHFWGHADMRQRLDTLAENNTTIVALIKAYAPHARTSAFTMEADKFRNYASAWRDRWNSVMELFMAGGNYPTSEVPFPKEFPGTVEAEIDAAGVR
jgi:protein-disulfide isomerase